MDEIELFQKITKNVQDRLANPEQGFIRRDANGNRFPLGRKAPAFNHSRGEQPYSVNNILHAILTRDWTHAALEKKFSDQLTAFGYAPSYPGGVMVPLGGDSLLKMPGYELQMEQFELEVKQAFCGPAVDDEEVAFLRKQLAAKAMSPLDDTLGGSLVPLPTQGPLIDFLRPQSVMSRAGAVSVPLPAGGGLYYPKSSGDPTFAFVGPNQPITDSDNPTGALTLTAKTAAGLVKMPNALIRYSSAVAEALVRQALGSRAALTVDKAGLEGVGGTLEPQGILNYTRSAAETPTVDMVTLHVAANVGSNGDTFDAVDPLKMLSLVEEADDPGATAWVMRPTMFYNLANARTDAATPGDAKGPFLYPITRGALSGAVEKILSGIPVLTSTQVSKLRNKGSNAALTYILAGDFREVVVGTVGAIEIASSEHAGFAADQTWIRAVVRFDVGLRHPQSFVVCDTLLIV